MAKARESTKEKPATTTADSKEPPGFVRVTISIKPEIKKRMDAVQASVNWSSIAASAFDRHLLELESKQVADSSIEAAAARLFASERLEEDEFFQAGHAAGMTWAMKRARFKELSRLEAAFPDGYVWDDGLSMGHDLEGRQLYLGEFLHLDEILMAVFGVKLDDHAIREKLLGQLLDRNDLWMVENPNYAVDRDFARGFIYGAKEAFEKMRAVKAIPTR